jgi:hypothetical protein
MRVYYAVDSGVNHFEHPDTIKNIWISNLCQATYAKNSGSENNSVADLESAVFL